MRQAKSEKMRQDRQDKKILRLVRNRIGQEYRMLNRNKNKTGGQEYEELGASDPSFCMSNQLLHDAQFKMS